MTHQWDRGVLASSSWHGLEEVGEMVGAEGMIAAGEYAGAWPTGLRFDSLRTSGGLLAPGRAVVATYKGHDDRCLSVVGDRYRATTPAEWRALVQAAVAAGGRPTGAFSLREGARVIGTFEVGTSNGMRTNLLLADAFDGSMRLTCGTTATMVVCANTMAIALKNDGAGMAMLRHTSSLEQKVNVLAESIGEAIATGEKVRATYHKAEALRMRSVDMSKVFDKLFPEASDDADKAARTRAENARIEASRAVSNPLNNAGPTLATLWNAATYLVDRTADGKPRATRGGDALDSMLFGARAERVAEIQTVIEVILADGRIQPMPAPQALAAGVDPRIVGRSVLDDILADM